MLSKNQLGRLFSLAMVIVVCCLSSGHSHGRDENGSQCPLSQAVQEDLLSLSGKQLRARNKEYAIIDGQVQLQKADYRLRANRMIYDNQRQLVRAQDNVMFTRCDPQHPSWFIAADQISLSKKNARVKNAWFVFGGTALFYIPRYQFGLQQQRKSGFLTPDVGNNSNAGFELGTPYYFNLAANRDAMLKPHYLSRHGLQLQGEFRYLNRRDSGIVRGEWLNSRRYRGDSYAYSIEHHFQHGNELNFDLSIQKISSADYFQNLGNSLDKVAEKYLPSFARLDYVKRGWQFSIAAESLQRADPDPGSRERPYVHRPNISLHKIWRNKKGWALALDSAWTRFETRRASDKPTGKRLNNSLSLQWDYRHPGFFIKPAVQLQNTRYSLSRSGDQNNSIRRTLPIFSLHTGLTLSKPWGNNFHNTLEPQLFYLRVGEKKQQQIPLFDTDESNFNFAQLFRHNRFNSHDRIGDANRLVGALTTRIIHSRTGKEALRAGVGYIERLSRERVGLNGTLVDHDGGADFASELAVNMNGRIRLQTAWAYDKDSKRSKHYNSRLSLVGGGSRAIHLSYHYRRDDINRSNTIRQLHLDFSQPLSEHWNVLGSWQRDVRNSRHIDILAGLEYKSCCWGMRLLAQRYINDVRSLNDTIDYNRSIGVEFSFSGIGNLGSNNERALSKKINNYRPF